MFEGDCEEALHFYKTLFGGEIENLSRFKDGPMETPDASKEKVMHAEFTFWGGKVMVSDTLKEAEYTTPAVAGNVHLSLSFKNTSTMKEVFEKLKEGGKVTMDLQETFWGDQFGMVQDRFGIQWMLSAKED